MRAFLILLIGLMGVVQIGPACSNCSVKDNWGFRQSCYQCGAPRPSKKAIALEKENVELRRKLAEKDGVKPTQDDGAADKDKAETPAELRKRCQALKEARKHLEQGGAAPELIASINSDIDKAEKQLQVDVPAGKQVTALNHQLKKLRQKDQKLADSLEANGEKLQQIKERMDDAVAQRAALKTDIEAAEREMQKAGVLLASQAAPPAEEHGYSSREARGELRAGGNVRRNHEGRGSAYGVQAACGGIGCSGGGDYSWRPSSGSHSSARSRWAGGHNGGLD